LPSLLVRNGTIVTMNDRLDVFEGAVSIRDGRIADVGPDAGSGPAHDRTIDAAGGFVLPGFIQTHIHLCQTLFRGYADDMPLLEWLRRAVWPMEAAHTPDTLAASARLAASELLLGGTTSILTMETVHDTEAVFDALEDTGIRATVGKCMMDADELAPPRLRENTRTAIDQSLAMLRQWNGEGDGRLRAAFAPRFAVSCSRELLESVAALSAHEGALVHTHASESRDEIEVVRRISGRANIEYFAEIGLLSPRLCVAHCVWVDEREQALLADSKAKVLHCPGSNLKLGSGIAPIAELLQRNVCVSLGADGAACNNRLDMFAEMRLAATLQAARLGPGALPAPTALWMATRHGARTLGLEHEIGSLEVGKRADLIVVDRDRPHLVSGGTPYSALVYAAGPADVRTVVVDGVLLVQNFGLTEMDAGEVAASGRAAARTLAMRAGV
jgi:5-methylthioadenosine/S-adenosylhomocysteine deaminase